MDRIKLHDKWFKVCIPCETIEQGIENVAEKLNKDMKGRGIPLFISVLNGSFMFTAELMKRIDFQCELSFVKLSSYSGTKSTGKIKQMIGLNRSILDRTVIIIEDIVDTGNTINELYYLIKQHSPKEIFICTLLLKPGAYDKELDIDYAAIEIPNDFIVGYGLDYNELGRQYKDIYVLDNNQK